MRRPQSPADTPPAGQRPSTSTNPSKGTNPGRNTGPSQTLTLTAVYKVLEALRQGRDLTAKEKAINDQGLVSVLKVLHDGLDAAGPAFLKPWRHWAGRGGRGMGRSAPTSRRQMGTKQSKLCPE